MPVTVKPDSLKSNSQSCVPETFKSKDMWCTWATNALEVHVAQHLSIVPFPWQRAGDKGGAKGAVGEHQKGQVVKWHEDGSFGEMQTGIQSWNRS